MIIILSRSNKLCSMGTFIIKSFELDLLVMYISQNLLNVECTIRNLEILNSRVLCNFRLSPLLLHHFLNIKIKIFKDVSQWSLKEIIIFFSHQLDLSPIFDKQAMGCIDLQFQFWGGKRRRWKRRGRKNHLC